MSQIDRMAAGGKPCELSPFRHRRLRRYAPHHEFRDQLIEPTNLDFTVNLVGGSCRSLKAVLEDADR
jgi:hypothetical protein